MCFLTKSAWTTVTDAVCALLGAAHAFASISNPHVSGKYARTRCVSWTLTQLLRRSVFIAVDTGLVMTEHVGATKAMLVTTAQCMTVPTAAQTLEAPRTIQSLSAFTCSRRASVTASKSIAVEETIAENASASMTARCMVYARTASAIVTKATQEKTVRFLFYQ